MTLTNSLSNSVGQLSFGITDCGKMEVVIEGNMIFGPILPALLAPLSCWCTSKMERLSDTGKAMI